MAKKGNGPGNVPEELVQMVKPHVGSFDYLATDGLAKVAHGTSTSNMQVDGTNLSVGIADVRLGKPRNAALPSDARERKRTYKAPLSATLHWYRDDAHAGLNGTAIDQAEIPLGDIPVMVCSTCCHLRGLQKHELVQKREEEHELGGYFVVNGNERIVRMVLVQRRHCMLALRRKAYLNRGPEFSELAVTMRCVKPDERSSTSRVHYMKTGTCRLAVLIRKQELFVPLSTVLKALVACTDEEIYRRLVGFDNLDDNAETSNVEFGDRTFIAHRVELMLADSQRLGLVSQEDHLWYLGKHFRALLEVGADVSHVDAGCELLQRHVLVHCTTNAYKFQLLLLMLSKLYALASGSCQADNPDALSSHEVLLPGNLLMMFLSDRLNDFLTKTQDTIMKGAPGNADEAFASSRVQKCIEIAAKTANIGPKMEYMLSTGNISNAADLGLSQSSGFTIIAEKVNYLRWLAHFRSVHRGQYFATLRTTTVRKMLPESWGFLCPVHTPDGSPCGLLNHLTARCQVQTDALPDHESLRLRLVRELSANGMYTGTAQVIPLPPAFIPVLIDGVFEGSLPSDAASVAASRLRSMKHRGVLPAFCELAVIEPSDGGTFPGVYIFTSIARMMRPVRHVTSNAVEYIGTFEQPFMDIACPDPSGTDVEYLGATHEELGPNSILSAVASLTPWSDFNQSPRNMYQCQMAKQTMGVPVHSFPHRHDNKMYRLQTPQKPLARTSEEDRLHVDQYPQGFNGVVAVVAYTGYDMEDAMIVNKASMERGLGHGSLYTTETITVADSKKRNADPETLQCPDFSDGDENKAREFGHVDADGLPTPGKLIGVGETYACTVNQVSGKVKPYKLRDSDSAYVDQVTMIGDDQRKAELQGASIKKRFPRNPIIGDKFSSRHGQKGTLSLLYPEEDMPFVESSGIRPDILINPNAFPSRMTIGMLIESFASKAGALRGEFVDATSFKKCIRGQEMRDPVDDFSELLKEEGYQRYGVETMVCGVTGELLEVDIFIGLVYYQRLRHMVSDKFQVRTVGPISNITHQPVKGRKAGGGIRFGEMERDALIAHGASYLLHDRLHLCSDRHLADICSKCGTFLSTSRIPATSSDFRGDPSGRDSDRIECKLCNSKDNVDKVAVPYVFRYLLVELAAMNVKVHVGVE